MDDSPVTPSVDEDENNTYLYFTYNFPSYYSHGDIKTVEIIGTYEIPEFPSWIILPLLIIATLMILICRETNQNVKQWFRWR